MSTYLGKYKAYVRDNADPQNRGRLRCYCPQVMGKVDTTAQWLDWAEVNLPWFGGVNTLDFGSPLTRDQNGGVEVGVWIEFEGGDPDHPIWTGTWLPAPMATSPSAQQNLTQAATRNGGNIIDDPTAGSTVGSLDPLQPDVGVQEARLLIKKGKDIYIGSVSGGGILIGPSGVHIVGMQTTINGRVIIADPSDKVYG